MGTTHLATPAEGAMGATPAGDSMSYAPYFVKGPDGCTDGDGTKDQAACEAYTIPGGLDESACTQADYTWDAAAEAGQECKGAWKAKTKRCGVWNAMPLSPVTWCHQDVECTEGEETCIEPDFGGHSAICKYRTSPKVSYAQDCEECVRLPDGGSAENGVTNKPWRSCMISSPDTCVHHGLNLARGRFEFDKDGPIANVYAAGAQSIIGQCNISGAPCNPHIFPNHLDFRDNANHLYDGKTCDPAQTGSDALYAGSSRSRADCYAKCLRNEYSNDYGGSGTRPSGGAGTECTHYSSTGPYCVTFNGCAESKDASSYKTYQINRPPNNHPECPEGEPCVLKWRGVALWDSSSTSSAAEKSVPSSQMKHSIWAPLDGRTQSSSIRKPAGHWWPKTSASDYYRGAEPNKDYYMLALGDSIPEGVLVDIHLTSSGNTGTASPRDQEIRVSVDRRGEAAGSAKGEKYSNFRCGEDKNPCKLDSDCSEDQTCSSTIDSNDCTKDNWNCMSNNYGWEPCNLLRVKYGSYELPRNDDVVSFYCPHVPRTTGMLVVWNPDPMAYLTFMELEVRRASTSAGCESTVKKEACGTSCSLEPITETRSFCYSTIYDAELVLTSVQCAMQSTNVWIEQVENARDSENLCGDCSKGSIVGKDACVAAEGTTWTAGVWSNTPCDEETCIGDEGSLHSFIDGTKSGTCCGESDCTEKTRSIAVGPTAFTDAHHALSIGDGASGVANKAVAVGKQASVTGHGGIAIGAFTVTEGSHGTAIGYDTLSEGFSTCAIGLHCQAKDIYATAIGHQAYAEGQSAIALGGNKPHATKAGSIAIGEQAQATGLQAIALGNQAEARSDNTIAIGYNTKIGCRNAGRGSHCEETSTTPNSIAIGNGVQINTEVQNSIAIGSSASCRGHGYQNGFRDWKGGNAAIAIGAMAKTYYDYAISIGYSASTRDNSIAIGENANCHYSKKGVAIGSKAASGAPDGQGGTGNVAIGEEAKARGDYSVAIGYKARASSKWDDALKASGGTNIAIGDSTYCAGYWSVAMGNEAFACSSNSVAIGNRARASCDNPTGITEGGVWDTDHNKPKGHSNIAIGLNAHAGGYWYNIVIGAGAWANTAGAIVIGMNAKTLTTCDYCIVIGARVHADAGGGFYYDKPFKQRAQDTTDYPTNVRRRLAEEAKEELHTTVIGGQVFLKAANIERVTQSSDRRVKKNIVAANTTAMLEHIEALQVRQYEYTENYLTHARKLTGTNVGFIAQEVEEVMGQAVITQGAKTLRKTVPVDAVDGKCVCETCDGTISCSHNQDCPVGGTCEGFKEATTQSVILEVMEDFKMLNKQMIFTELVGAVQELSTLLNAATERIKLLESLQKTMSASLLLLQQLSSSN